MTKDESPHIEQMVLRRGLKFVWQESKQNVNLISIWNLLFWICLFVCIFFGGGGGREGRSYFLSSQHPKPPCPVSKPSINGHTCNYHLLMGLLFTHSRLLTRSLILHCLKISSLIRWALSKWGEAGWLLMINTISSSVTSWAPWNIAWIYFF